LDNSTYKFSNCKKILGGAGTQSAALAFGGNTGSITNATEEYNDYGEPNVFENVGQVWYNGTTKALKFTDETFSRFLGNG
jgi:hypothetical protein